MVKISEMQMAEVRKEITFIDVNGDKKVIKIFNPSSETKEKLIVLIDEATNDKGELLLDGNTMLTEVFPLLTDIEIDIEDINDILDRPSNELVLVNSEINTIFNEISMEMFLNQRHEYEKLLILSEQVYGINMVAYIKERMAKLSPFNDFDPLNSKAKEERDAKEAEELRQNYESIKNIFEVLQKDEAEEVKEDGISE